MKYFVFLLNLPWTFVGLVGAVLSVPIRVRFTQKPAGIIIYVRSFWWLTWLSWYKRARAITNGHVIQLGPLADERDLQHELIHVEQAARLPLVLPLLHTLEWLRHGYRHNKYEAEAFERSGSRYTGPSK